MLKKYMIININLEKEKIWPIFCMSVNKYNIEKMTKIIIRNMVSKKKQIISLNGYGILYCW